VINFRYHVVSLTAVFLALAIGLVVGTTALNGPISDSFKEQVDELRKQNQQLREDLNHLDEEVRQKEDFARQAAPALLGRKLAGSRVLLVTVPSGIDYASGVAGMLTTSGATITGQVDIKDKFLDPTRNEELLDLAHTSLPKCVLRVGQQFFSETSSSVFRRNTDRRQVRGAVNVNEHENKTRHLTRRCNYPITQIA